MSLKYHGRPNAPDVGVGNKFFLFFTGVIYAKKHNLKIIAKGDRNPYQKINKLVKIKNYEDIEFKNGKDKEYNTKTRIKRNYYSDGILKYPENKDVILEDYFHDTRYILENIDIVMNFIDLNYYRKPSLDNIEYSIGDNDILCQIRLGDFVSRQNNVLHPSYFTNIFEENNFDNIYIIVYPFNDQHKESYLKYLEKYMEKITFIECNDEKQDFYFPYLFNNIAVSNSTFNWWSVFLNSDSSKKIYIPRDKSRLQYNLMWDNCIWKDAKYIETNLLKNEN